MPIKNPKSSSGKKPKSLAQELWQKILLSKPAGPHLNDVSLCLTTNFNDGDGGSRPDNSLAFFFLPPQQALIAQLISL
jgi:hypothetical protein